MESLKTIINRWRQTRGYGVQSPNDYGFIRNVIAEKMPYYAYRQLEKEHGRLNKKTCRKCQLLFRIANYCQPRLTIVCNNNAETAKAYMQAGCKQAKTISVDCEKDAEKLMEQASDIGMIYINADGKWFDFLLQASQKLADKAACIIDNIHSDKETEEKWNKLKELPSIGSTYDLRHCGIILFEKKQYKKHYLLNY